ncbi:AMP-binding protein [Phenylobacterium sp. LjRoot164]|uniref:AMP-binding protein n=1 Tax=unclassified Phenylobacterium TaxID=2640670 RepID=UPI003ECF6C13
MRPFWTLDVVDADRPALIAANGDETSYRALSQSADRWAAELQALAAGRTPLLLLDFAATPEAIAAYLGALRAGFPVILQEPGASPPGSRIDEVWTPDVHLKAAPAGRMLIEPRAGWQARDWPRPHPDLALLLSTSGSTGEPKMVRLSRDAVASNADAIAQYLRLTADDRAAATLPLFYSYGMSVLNSYLSVGAALALSDRSVSDPAFLPEARAAGVTSLALVPHQFELLAASGFSGAELPRLRYVTQAGGRLAPDMVRRFSDLGLKAGWDLVLMYGQTEAAPRIAWVPPQALPEAADTIGQAIPGGRIWLAGENGDEIAGVGRPGELVYEGPNVMMGYATGRAGLAAPPGPPQLRTGDIAERTPQGFYRIVGRMKRFVKLFGLRLSLDQIELALGQAGVRAHAVGAGDRLVLLVRDAAQVDAARTLVASLYDLPPAAIATALLADPPLLPSGKIDQQALEQIAAEAADASLAARREAAASGSLAAILREATRSPTVAPHDSFTSLGGDSLSYLTMQLALEDRLGRAPSGWENMTLAELEAMVPADAARPPLARIDTDLLLRLLAISLVVAQHASDYPIRGGTWALIAVMGFSMSRFQLRQIADGDAVAFARRLLYPIVPLYFLLLAAYGLMREPPPLSYVLLVGNYQPLMFGSLLGPFWFVSLYAQIVVVMALVAALGPLRREVAARPWRSGLIASALLAPVLAVLALVQQEQGLPYVGQRGLPEAFSVFVLGWMMQAMRGRRQVAATIAMAILTLALLDRIDMNLQVLGFTSAALAILGLRVSIPAPRWLGRLAATLGMATLYVYLLHSIVIHYVDPRGLSDPANIAVALTLSFAIAWIAYRAFGAADGLVRARLGGLLAARAANLR